MISVKGILLLGGSYKICFFISENLQLFNSKSSKISDASFIGLDCPSGDVRGCNDGTLMSAPPECGGALILSEEESQCGSYCDLGPNLRSAPVRNRKKWWTHFKRQAQHQ